MTHEDAPRLLMELARLDPRDRIVRLRAAGRPEERLVELSEAAEALAIGDLPAAIDASGAVVDLADEVDDARCRLRARRARAQALAYASRFEEAMAVLDEALRIARDASDEPEAARIRMTRVHALAKLGRYEEAIREGEAARSNLLEVGEPVLAARCDTNLGVVERMRDRPAEALHHFDRARPLVAGDPLTVAQLESNRGEALLDLGRFPEAEDSFRAALARFESMGVAHAAAIVEGNLADLMSRQGRLHGALYHFERARRQLARSGSPGELGRLEAEQAEALLAAGMIEEAIEVYGDAIPRLLEHGLAWDAARALAGLGRAAMQCGHYAQAADALDRAARGFRDLGHATGEARVGLLRGDLYLCTGERRQANDAFRATLRSRPEDSLEAVTARLRLATADLEADELAGAEAHLAGALASAGRMGHVPSLAELRGVRAALRRRQGRDDEAIADLREACRLVERLRGRLPGDRARRAFLGAHSGAYADLVAALLDRGERAEAFETIERAKGRALLDLASGAIELVDVWRSTATDPEQKWLLEEVAGLQGELHALYAGYDQLRRVPGHEPPPDRRASIEHAERRLQVLECRVAAARGVPELFAPPAQLAQVQALLPAHSALVEYFDCGGELLAFVVRPGRVEVFRDLADLEELGAGIESLRFQVGRALSRVACGREPGADLIDDARDELRGLERCLVAPLRGALEDATAVHVVPHGPLHEVPFAALHDGHEHLVARLEITSCPSAGLLCDLLRRVGPSGRLWPTVVAAVGDPAAPRAADEADLVGSIVPGPLVLRGQEATRERVARAVAGAGLVHLACHGRFVPANPLASGLRLGDGWLTVRDIYGLRVDGAVIVLSGCETGRAQVQPGDELIGLVRAFLAAGASCVLVSLWPVSDEMTARLMKEFYEEWCGDGPPGTLGASGALRRAQIRLIRQQVHPAFWAPFTVIGRG
jgi:tetratricopeptide (TPR) repeat protein